jgi:heme-degrading monooxygenase HmoA
MHTTLTKITMGVLLLAACEENQDADDGAMQVEETGAVEETGSSGGEMNFDELYDCIDEEVLEIAPLAGPGWDGDAGLLDPVQENYVASTTMIMVKPEQQGLFLELVGGVQEQLASTDGFVAMSLATDPNCGWARTLTVWRDETSMYTFVATGAHAEAMNRTWEVAVTGKVASWPIAASEMPPTWAAAQAQLAAVEPLGGY